MNLKIRHSLLMSLGIVMATITLLAVTSMAASLFIAETIQGQATAINESGSLRMRSYRIASSLVYDIPDDQHWQTTHILITEFEQHLQSPALTDILPEDNLDELRIAYNNIVEQWELNIKPIFDIYLEGISDEQLDTDKNIDLTISKNAVINLRNQYFLMVSDFVDDIDDLVKMLEQNAESNIQRLRLYQYIILVLTIFLVITALILVYKRVHVPMKKLLLGAEQVRNRNFTYRTSYTGQDELGQLSNAFNSMSEDLSLIYNELEERVQQKTQDLERSNRSMELLYKIVKQLNEATAPQETFPEILKDIGLLIGSANGSICLSKQSDKKAAMLASTIKNNDFSKSLCIDANCSNCMGNNKTQYIDLVGEDDSVKQIITIPISDHNKQHGVLIIEPTDDTNIEQWQIQLLENITGHIGASINLSQLEADTRRLSLIEERGAIARELHDSLAQSLTFMKIQVSRLQTSVKNEKHALDTKNIINELKLGLNSAYKELRELLTTFRLKIDGEDFNEALNKTIEEFNERGDVIISCENKITYYDLTPNEEIHLLQLIREALSNIVQHSKATRSTVTLRHNSSTDIEVLIEDNGIGLVLDKSRKHHYGLSIMKERALTLDAYFDISKKADGGTLIQLIFTPTNITTPVNINKHQTKT